MTAARPNEKMPPLRPLRAARGKAGGGRWVQALLGLLLVVPRAPALAQDTSATMLRYRPTWWDAATVSASVVLYTLPDPLGLPRGSPSCAPCSAATLPWFDRWAVTTPATGPDVGSDVVLLGVAGWTALAGLLDAPRGDWAGNFAVYADAASSTAAATEWLKVLVRRKRPILYTDGALAAAGDPDNQQSFPSIHAGLAFAAATSYLIVSGREHLPHRTRNAILLYAGAAAVSALRVASGQHFPSDVLAGAALGSGIGWLVPTIHAKVP